MSHDEMRGMIRQYVNAYNDFDVDGMLLTVHSDIEFKNIVNGETNAATRGIADFRRLAEHSKTLFSERRQTIESLEVGELEAVAALTFRAVLANDLSDGLKKGQVLNLTGRSEFHFRNGLIFRLWDFS